MIWVWRPLAQNFDSKSLPLGLQIKSPTNWLHQFLPIFLADNHNDHDDQNWAKESETLLLLTIITIVIIIMVIIVSKHCHHHHHKENDEPWSESSEGAWHTSATDENPHRPKRKKTQCCGQILITRMIMMVMMIMTTMKLMMTYC